MAIPPRKIPNVLEWKFAGVEGIETRENDDTGAIEITAWPKDQGAKPTATQLVSWFSEWRAAGEDRRQASIEDRLEALEKAAIKKNVISRAEIDAELPSDVKPRGAALRT
ncbi:MAG: hypothetical protein AAF563_12430 [Pseudomonadota bacterium]